MIVLFDRDTSLGVIVVFVAISGAGIGFTFQPTLVALQAHCTKAQRAVVISNRNFFRCMGGACGLAISAAVLQATLRSNLPAEFSYLAHSTYSLPPRSNLTDTQWAQILQSYSQASHAVFILQVPLIGMCLLACLLIRDRGLERPKDPEELEEEERKSQAERDVEAAVAQSQAEDSEHEQDHDQVEKCHSMTTTLAEESASPAHGEKEKL